MRVIVPIKQVPETSNVKMDPETGTIVRAGSEAVVNPLDLYAIEAALQLREVHGGSVEVISMGPARAETAIREAIAMGCDGGTLVSDKKFGGADTWSTSYILAQAIRNIGEFDLIIAGERATDGDTAQVGPGIASWLDIPVATYVARIVSVDSAAEPGAATLTVERLVEEGYQRVRVQFPALITVVKEIATPRLPTLRGKKEARRADVPVLNGDSLDVDPTFLGLKGSPTKVVSIRTPKVTRGGRLVHADQDVSVAVSELLAFLGERDLVGRGQTMSFVWTIAEQHGGELKAVSYELLARGRTLADDLGTELASVVIGNGVDNQGLQSLVEHGADVVYSIQDPGLAEFVCESYSHVLEHIIKTYSPTVVLGAATTLGRTLLPHVAVRVNTGLTADCTELSIEPGTDNLLQTRPAIGGNIMATIKTPDHRPQMATVRPRSTRPLPRDPDRTGKIISVPVDQARIDNRVQVLGYRTDDAGFVNLEEAEMVVAGGRGLKRGDNFALIRQLAEVLRAEVGASRDAVDRGWIAYSHQVGLSGKTISPRLYIGCGISGSIQHLAGIKTAETIVSINSDPDAPLHSVADFAIVGDLFEVVPELIRRLGDQAVEGVGSEEPGSHPKVAGRNGGPQSPDRGNGPRRRCRTAPRTASTDRSPRPWSGHFGR